MGEHLFDYRAAAMDDRQACVEVLCDEPVESLRAGKLNGSCDSMVGGKAIVAKPVQRLAPEAA